MSGKRTLGCTIEQAAFAVSRGFLTHIAFNDPLECWKWEGACYTNRNGHRYGRVRISNDQYGSHSRNAHVIGFVLGNRIEVPAGMEIDHTCQNTLCVNWMNHLDLVTPSENMRRAWSRVRV